MALAALLAVLSGCAAGPEPVPSELSLASVGPLLDRTAYAALDRDGADAVRRAAESVPEWSAILTESFRFVELTQHACGGQSHWMAVYRHSGTGIDFVLIPGGEFDMGSPLDEAYREVAENQQRVSIARPFLIAVTELTESQWRKVEGARPMDRHGDPARYPATQISWREAAAWCVRAGLALPTDAQWEYACRAGTTGRFCAGSAPGDLATVAWIKQNSDGRAHAVGELARNAFGLADVHGNVAEYCSAAADFRAGTLFEPQFESGLERPMRGGAYTSIVRDCRAAYRRLGPTSHELPQVGFRPVRLLP